MKYYRILPSGIRKKLALHRTWGSDRAGEFYKFFGERAGHGDPVPDGLSFTANAGINATDLGQLRACAAHNINSIVFSQSTVELIRPVCSQMFEFVPCTLLTRDRSFESEFFAVRFFEQRRFADHETRMKYIDGLVKGDVHPLFESGLDFKYACQDPVGDDWVVTDDFIDLIDPIIKLRYLELTVELRPD